MPNGEMSVLDLQVAPMKKPQPETPSIVYLLHFSRRFHHARHYLGFTTRTATQRLHDHLHKKGAVLVQAAVEAGIKIKVVYTETLPTASAARLREKELKSRGSHLRLCPLCKDAARRRDAKVTKARRHRARKERKNAPHA